MLQQVLKAIDVRSSFVLTSHARPDGDAVGSVLACGQVLRSMGKQAHMVLRDPVPLIYAPLPHSQEVVQTTSVSRPCEAAILLECDSVQRTAIAGLDDKFLINIDHHQSGVPFAHVNWIEPSACATAEMVYWLAREAGVKITPEIATCLYAAVLADTGAFSYSCVSERTFLLAQELVGAGANPSRIAQNIYFSNPTSKMRLLGAALSTLHREGRLAWMHSTRQQMDRLGALDEDHEGLVNYALGIRGVEVAVFFRELPDARWRVSLRLSLIHI